MGVKIIFAADWMTVYNGVFREFLESARQRTVLS